MRIPRLEEERLRTARKISTAIVLIVSVVLFWYILTLDVPSLTKGMYAIILLVVSGILIRKTAALEGWFCLILLKSQSALRALEWGLARFGKMTNTLSDIGLVFAFGASSWLAFPQIHVQKRLFVLAMLAFCAYLLLLPTIFGMLAEIIGLPVGAVRAEFPVEIAAVSLVVVLAFGLVGAVVLALLENAARVVATLVEVALTGQLPLLPAIPGIGPVLPGLTIPLVEGAIAIAVLIVVHEGAHGLAARLARIRTKSAGLLTFGFIPIGAFVDIDEEQLERKREVDRSRVIVAGSAANFIACVPALVLALLLAAVLSAMYAPGVVIVGFARDVNVIGAPLNVGTKIIAINDIEINTLQDFVKAKERIGPNETITLKTDIGTSYVTTDANATVGIVVQRAIKERVAWPAVRFAYTVFALIAGLNFFVGAINLLPVWIFDGQRLLRIGIKNKTVTDIISWIVAAALILNLLPWAWT